MQNLPSRVFKSVKPIHDFVVIDDSSEIWLFSVTLDQFPWMLQYAYGYVADQNKPNFTMQEFNILRRLVDEVLCRYEE